MRVVSVALAVQASILVLLFSNGAQAADFGRHAADKGGNPQQGRILHELPRAFGARLSGYLPIPRLAGQQGEYFENQLTAFEESKREKIKGLRMSKVHQLSAGTRAKLAAYFQDLHARWPAAVRRVWKGRERNLRRRNPRSQCSGLLRLSRSRCNGRGGKSEARGPALPLRC